MIIFGQSAGSFSVRMHLVPPTFAGLFRQAIAQSGNCASSARTEQQAETSGMESAAKVGMRRDGQGCPVSACAAGRIWLGAWPCGLSVVGGLELPLRPPDALRQDRFNHVLLILGNVRGEMRLFVSLAFDPMGTPVMPDAGPGLRLPVHRPHGPLVDVPGFEEGAGHTVELNRFFSRVPIGRSPLNAEQ